MAPRKRHRPNPAPESSSSTSLPAGLVPSQRSGTSTAATSQSSSATSDLAPPASAAARQAMGSQGAAASASVPNIPRQIQNKGSWSGSWPRAPKSSASTQLARENIFSGTLKPSSAPDLLRRFDTKRSIDTASLEVPAELPNIPETGQVAATAAPGDEGGEAKMAVDEPPKPAGDSEMKDAPDEQPAGESNVGEDIKRPVAPPRPGTSSGWMSWFGRSPAAPPPATPTMTEQQTATTEAPAATEAPKDAAVVPPPASEAPPAEDPMTLLPEPAVELPKTDEGPKPPVATTYWFDFWSSRNNIKMPEAPTQPGPDAATTKPEEQPQPPPQEQQDVVMEDAPPEPPATPTPAPVPAAAPPSAGSTWAFWSRDTRPKSSSGTSTPKPEAGELAVIGDGSEDHPKVANSPTMKDTPAKEPQQQQQQPAKGKATPAIAIPEKKNKRLRPQSMDVDVSSPPGPSTPTQKSDLLSKTPKQDMTPRPESQKGESSRTASAAKEAPNKALPPNLLLPSFSSTYHMKENPSILKQIAQLLMRTQQPAANHVFRVKEPPKLKKAIAIGVHGFFPASYLRPMIGQPTGTSLRFASLCADAVRRWAEANGCGDCEIEKVALEGEGKIADRVNNLWKLLLNWIDHIRSADLILLACHSQGVPVAVMLLAKLIDLGIITNAKIGVCAMAGVSLGPFPDYKSSMGILMGSAAELWEFSNPESEVSQRYEHSLKEVLQYGVRITYIGSIDDQLVPLESAIYSPANHPYIYRAVFIDGRIHAPDFIAHLVGFALKLRNLGVSDHGLIRELSVPLAGSLYSGEGHSRLYFDDQVYDLAVLHALETTTAGNVGCHIQKHGGVASSNPYHLPWIMRGLLEEDFVKTELSAETDLLLKQFDDWKPVTKALKDVKYRLEAVRSKL